MTVAAHSAGTEERTPDGIALRCPLCSHNVSPLECEHCGFQMNAESDLVHALPLERQLYFSRFITDYEHIRRKEGRASQNEAFYLALPYVDTSGRNSGQWKIRAKSFDFLMSEVLNSLNSGVAILDLGAGNCWMSYRLSLRGFKPVAVDLLINQDDGLSAAKHFRPHLERPIPCFQAELHHLPFQDAQFDAAIFNASLHYSENYEEALREALRCLKPGGSLIICDTPWYSHEENGHQMVAERQAMFRKRFHTASNSLRSLEFLTDERLETLERTLGISWTTYRPWYGLHWYLRPLIAKWRKRREPSQFRIYVTKKDCRAC
jgi:SAM-dependent methyltransferase